MVFDNKKQNEKSEDNEQNEQIKESGSVTLKGKKHNLVTTCTKNANIKFC